jgi:glyoxylase-like metal-dependent hydrolase (beta-lactamase superfamily II)
MKPLTLGEYRIDRVAEIERLYVDPKWQYYNIEQEMLIRHKDALGPLSIHPETLQLGLSFHSFVIRTRGLNILVDTCNGNHKDRMPRFPFYHNLQATTYIENLAKLGLRPEDIDIVLCTHLHTDHVGWNTQLVDGDWVPTFPNAKYIMARQEYEYFKRLWDARDQKPMSTNAFEDSVLPVVNAGRADLVDMNHLVAGEVGEGVWMEPAVGHTPGHVTIHVKGDGREAIMIGDIIHHPIVFLEPSLATSHDVDKAECDRTRQRVLERLADTNDILLTAHFCAPTSGRVMSCSHGFKFDYLEDRRIAA